MEFSVEIPQNADHSKGNPKEPKLEINQGLFCLNNFGNSCLLFKIVNALSSSIACIADAISRR
jgi:hypothetical protein